MNEEQKPYDITYTFHIQSVEDFYNQLREYADTHYNDTDVDDVTLAKNMLASIGVNCGK